jgi:hypothetical protein
MGWTHPFISGLVSAIMVVAVTIEPKGTIRNADDHMTY